MMRRAQPRLLYLATILLCGLLSACGRERSGLAPATLAAGTTSTGSTSATIQVDSVERRYRIHMPQGRAGALPLVIALHGFSSNAALFEQVSQLSAKADAEGFVVAYPEGSGNPQRWHFGIHSESQADIAFIQALIQQIQRDASIDPQRIYITGMSNGAEMSFRLACDLGDTIAAIAPVSGAYPPYRDCASQRAVPAIAFHGTDDDILAYAGNPPLFQPVHTWAETWAAHNGCGASPQTIYQQDNVLGERWGGCQGGADVELYTIQGGGHSWPGSPLMSTATTSTISATDRIWSFFRDHPLSPTP